MSPPFLMRLLKGAKSLSEARAYQLAKRLRWPAEQRSLFIALVRIEKARNPTQKRTLQSELTAARKQVIGFRNIRQDVITTVSHWYYFAITELVRVKGFVADPIWIGKRLGIAKETAAAAVERLLKTGMVQASGKTLLKSHANYTSTDVPSSAIREFHRQMLDKAKDALKTQSPEERDITGVTMAIDPDRLPEAKERIRAFRREMMQFLEDGEPRKVYQLSIQLFRLEKD